MEIKLTHVRSLFRKRLLLLIMRTFIFLLCTTVFGFTSGSSFSQEKVTIDRDQIISIDQVFRIIKSQTDYRFIYPKNLFKDVPKVQLTKGEILISDLLKKSFSSSDLNLTVSNDNTIVINKKSIDKSVVLQTSIKGKVTDENGIPLAGVTVLIKGTSTGVTSNFDGNYSIAATKGAILNFSYVGMLTVEVTVGDNSTIDVTLKSDLESLEEVVLIGYGTQKRDEISSAISSVDQKDISNNSIGQSSFDQSLAGLVKGVQIRPTNGAPGARVDINIRGYTSPFSGSDNNPLFVIDGVPFQANPNITRTDETSFTTIQNPLLSINPDDIESIDVLKDAAATSIYGSRGANGVIIVKTKQGKRNTKTQISFSSTATFSKPIAVQNYLNAAENRTFLDTYFRNSFQAAADGIIDVNSLLEFEDIVNITPELTYAGLKDSYFGTGDTDWNKEVYRNLAYSQNHSLSFRGGSETSTYFFSGNFRNQEGLVKKDNFKQYNLRISLDNTVSKTISFGTNINLGYSNARNGQGFGGFFPGNLSVRPDIPAYDANGNVTRIPGVIVGFPSSEPSPLGNATLNRNTTKGYNVLGNVFMKVNIDDYLSLKADLNGSYLTTSSYQFFPNTLTGFELPVFGIDLTPANSYAYDSTAENTTLTTDVTAAYDRNFGKHSLQGLAGASWTRLNSQASFNYLLGFPDDFVLTNPSNANTSDVSSSSIESGLNSLFGRLTYGYDSRYSLTATARVDQSSKFAPGNKNAFFPSISASWNVANEQFLKESETFSVVRLRASAGETGSTNLGDFAFLQGFSSGFREDGLYVGGTAIGLGNELANENASWETTTEVNFGLDLELFNRRFRSSLDIYHRKTDGALVSTPIPLESGLSDFTSNFIDLTNQGFELAIGGDIIKTETFNWSANFNISKNRNRIDNLTSTMSEYSAPPYEVGREIGLIRGFVVEGIYQSQTEIDVLNSSAPSGTYSTIGTVGPGDYKYSDINGDGEITQKDGYGIIGSTQPDFFGGFNTAVSYKSFELSAYFNFSKGADLRLSEGGGLNPDPRANSSQRYDINNRWSPTNTGASLPILLYRGGNDVNTRVSTANVFDTSFIRLKNIQLKYSLPSDVSERLGIGRMSLFVAGSNLLTWTDFPGLDPENTSNSGTNGGRSYPNSKTWSLGINLNF